MARNVTRRGGPPRPASNADVDRFLTDLARTPAPATVGRGRLIFALDATASREPAWDSACHIQAEMFKETEALGGLEIQLVYYRGFGECRATKWLADSDTLVDRMVRVRCLGGRTQIRKVLRHAVKETEKQKVNALVFVGDACEEKVDLLCDTAGQLGLLGVPAFLFHEGPDPAAEQAFRQIATLTGGAYCRFDANSAQHLRDLLSAVAVFAAGGRRALEDFGRKRGGAVLQITRQVR
ncbi:MAG: VWA domain-containing protein [Bauldia litoralis]